MSLIKQVSNPAVNQSGMDLGSPGPSGVLSLHQPTFHTACCVTDIKLQSCSKIRYSPLRPSRCLFTDGRVFVSIFSQFLHNKEFSKRSDTKVKFQNKFLNFNSLSLCESVCKCNGVKYLSFPKGSEHGTVFQNTRSRSGFQYSTCFISRQFPDSACIQRTPDNGP
jgi:hypothetical protein